MGRIRVADGEIEAMIGARQPTVSQQLARLRADGLVEARRDGKSIYYTLICSRMRRLLESLDELYGVLARRITANNRSELNG